MTPSAPPPRSAAHYLSRSAFHARSLAIVLGLVVSARFAYAALSHALEVTTGAVAVSPRPHPTESSPVLAPEPSLTPARQAALAPVPSGDSPAAGRPVSVMLSVDYGTPRSDVYVNGRKVGQTPYLGDTSCKAGQALKIEIVQAKGVPLTYDRVCVGGSLQIESPPP